MNDAAYKRTVAPRPEIWKLSLGSLYLRSSGRIRKGATRFVTRNYNDDDGSMTGVFGQLKLETL